MITISNLAMQFGGSVLFKQVDLQFVPGNCYGIIGANGAGKSTFLKILSGELEATSGQISIKPGARMSVLKQDQNQYDAYTILDTVIMGNQHLYDVMKEKDALYEKPDFSEEDGMRASELEAEFADMDGWEAESDASKLLQGLGIPVELHYDLMGNTDPRLKVKVLLAQALDLYWLADGYFTDVAKESWYAPSVNAMAAIGLVSGVGGGKFDPNATMTQEEFITVLGNLVEFVNLDARAFLDKKPLAILQPLPKYRNRGFSPWAIRGVEVLTNSVFDEDGNAVNLYCTAFEDIKPKAPILREQAAAALCRALRTTGVIED